MLSPSSTRGTAAAASLAIILLLPLTGAAQTGSGAPGASPGASPADPCAAWHTTFEEAAGSRSFAVQADQLSLGDGHGTRPVAFDSQHTEAPTSCAFTSAVLEELGEAGSIFDILGLSTAYSVPDEAGDAIALNGAEPAEPVYDLDPLVSIFFGRTNELKRREWLAASAALAKRPDVTFGSPRRQWLRQGGAIELTYIRGAVPDPAKPHSFEIGFMGTDASKTLPATLVDVDPLAGVRRLVSLYLTTQGGKQSAFVGVTDFGDRGSDGSMQYYNAPARAFAVVVGDGVVLGYPASFDPLGMRPMVWDNATGIVDIGHAPDGPMAFIPSSGSATSAVDGVAFFVEHVPTSAAGVVVNGGAPQVVDGTARQGLVFSSGRFDPLAPPVLDIVFKKVGGERWKLDSVAPEVVDRTFFTYAWPIPGRGDYAYQSMRLRLPTVDTTGPSVDDQAAPALVEDFSRVLGGYRYKVDRSQGIYNPPFLTLGSDEHFAELMKRLTLD